MKLCPICNGVCIVKKNETFSYDPIVSVEVITYYCPYCKNEEIIEYLKQE